VDSYILNSLPIWPPTPSHASFLSCEERFLETFKQCYFRFAFQFFFLTLSSFLCWVRRFLCCRVGDSRHFYPLSELSFFLFLADLIPAISSFTRLISKACSILADFRLRRRSFAFSTPPSFQALSMSQICPPFSDLMIHGFFYLPSSWVLENWHGLWGTSTGLRLLPIMVKKSI